MPGTTSTMQFEIELTQITTILAPFAKAILCLESSHSTTADVYIFWLAAMALLQETMQLDIVGLTVAHYEQIRAYSNMQFNKIINNAPTDAYLTAFALNPTYCDANILKNINPLATLCIV
jgi:hypothetical protein